MIIRHLFFGFLLSPVGQWDTDHGCKNFNTDFEHWNGKMWALLAINAEYYEYLIKGNCD